MPEEQSSLTPTVWTLLTLGVSVCPMAVYCDGLHHRTNTLGRMRSALGRYRPVHKDGALSSSWKQKENGGRPSGYLCLRNLEIPRATHGYRKGVRLPIHLRNLAGVPSAVWYTP